MGVRVDGYCPMGCGQTLRAVPFKEDRFVLMCGALDCPRSLAASELLDDHETEHRVVFDEDGFTIRHPLRERLDDALLQCDCHVYLSQMPSELLEPGRYRMIRGVSGWNFEGID